MEFVILDNGLRSQNGHLTYQWYKLADSAGRQFYRAVALLELLYLPVEARADPDMLGKQWAALRGLYNAQADFLYSAVGVFAPQRLGVIQFYGAAAEAATEEEAGQEVRRRIRAVEAVLANFPQSRTAPPTLERVELFLERVRRLPRLLAILGHPDPRLARKGLGRDGSLGEADDELLSQQGENLLRGLARINQDFVFLVTAAHVERPAVTSALVRMAQVASQLASRQRGSIGAAFSLAIPLAAALNSACGQNFGRTLSAGRSQADTVSEGWGWSQADSWSHSVGHSESHGQAHTVSTSVADGIAHAHGVADTSSWSQVHSLADTTSHAETSSWAHTDSVADTSSWAHTDSVADTSSWAHTDSVADTSSWAHTGSVADTTSHSTAVAHAGGASHSTTDSTSSAWTTGSSHSETSGVSNTTSSSQSNTVSGGVGARGELGLLGTGVEVGGNANYAHGWTSGASQETSSSTSETLSASATSGEAHSDTSGSFSSTTVTGVSGTAHTTGHTDTAGGAHTVGHADTVGGAHTVGHADTVGGAHTVGRADTRGGATTVGSATTRGTASGTGGSHGVSDTTTRSHTVTSGTADSESWSQATSEGWSVGRTNGRSYNAGRSHGTGVSEAIALATAGGRGYSAGLSSGLVPGVAITRSWQTEDDTAIRLTEIARGLEGLLNTASVEGGFMTTALLLATEEGERAAQALVPQAFHGPNVPTPVLTVPGEASLRDHVLAFRPSLIPDGDPFGVGVLWSRWGTLLTPAMLAAYTCPNLFEEGTAVTIQEKLPPLAFYPETRGEVVLGHQISPETGDLTATPLRLEQQAHFHTAFCADTGYGKSVAALRLAYETTLHWHLRTVVLDFGVGWRRLLNAPGLQGHVEIRQLSPGGVRPLRWNPLQIGRAILPEIQWRAFADIFGTVAQLGQKRQIHELREMLRRVYLAAGVLVDDPECRRDHTWGRVRPGEDAITGHPVGTPLGALPRQARQALAVERSRHVGLADLYQRIQGELQNISPKDIRRPILEGICYRLQPLVQGEAALQYAAGPDAIDINDIVPGEWGVAVLEGGAFLDEFSKAFLLGWAAWHFYTHAVVHYGSNGGRGALQIFFEEANKILAGLDARPDDEGGLTTAEQFANMWRDSRKYNVWLHLITQSPALIPLGILASCNNIFIGQLKNARDRDAVVAAVARSEKGFVDEPWRRFLASLPVGRMVVKLGYQADRARLEPVYLMPLMLNAAEPSDEDIAATLGELRLAA